MMTLLPVRMAMGARLAARLGSMTFVAVPAFWIVLSSVYSPAELLHQTGRLAQGRIFHATFAACAGLWLGSQQAAAFLRLVLANLCCALCLSAALVVCAPRRKGEISDQFQA